MNDLLTAEKRQQYYLLRIEGKFNIATTMKIRKAAECAIKAGHNTILFDFEKITEIDKHGIRLLITLYKDFMSSGRKICITSPSPEIAKILHKTGVQKLFKIYKSIENAEQAFRKDLYKEERGFYILIRLPKEFDLNVVKPLRDTINESIQAGHSNIVFDFEETNYITSVGIGVLMNLHKNLQEKGGSIYLVGIPEKIRTVLKDTNILKILPEYETVGEVDEKFL